MANNSELPPHGIPDHGIRLPIRRQTDIEDIERLPLEQRITDWDVNSWIWQGCSLSPEKVASFYIADGDVTSAPVVTTYRDLAKKVIRTANLFHSLGVSSNDVIAFLLPNVPDVYAITAASIARGIVAPMNWMLDSSHLTELLRTSNAKVIVTLGATPGFDIWEKVQRAAPQLPPGTKILSMPLPGAAPQPEGDLATLAEAMPEDRLLFNNVRQAEHIAAYIHSSGTTGAPKFVQITHRGIVYKIWSSRDLLSYGPNEVFFADYPFFHVAGLVNRAIVPLAMGMSMVLPSIMGARDRAFINNYWRFVERFGITQLSGVPTTLSLLAKMPPQGEDLSSLRSFTTTGSQPLPVEVARQIERLVNVRVLLTYGSTEYTTTLTQTPPRAERRHGSTGMRMPYTQVRTVKLGSDSQIERECTPGEIGTVIAKGPGITPGYLNPEHNRGVFTQDRWFISGDLGRIDADGYLWLTGRTRDLIIRGGHNIDPALIEEPLLRHPAVLYAAAVGRPDAYAGEVPVAYVKLADGASASEGELLEFVHMHIAERPAAPAQVYIVDDFPLTDVRKPAKNVLRHDAARRIFEDVIRDLLPPQVSVSVTAAADQEKGTLVTVSLSAAPAQREKLEAAVVEKLSAFSLASHIVWRDAGAPAL